MKRDRHQGFGLMAQGFILRGFGGGLTVMFMSLGIRQVKGVGVSVFDRLG